MERKSDIAIAQETPLLPIGEIAREAGIPEEYIEPYGRYKAKIDDKILKERTDKPEGKLI